MSAVDAAGGAVTAELVVAGEGEPLAWPEVRTRLGAAETFWWSTNRPDGVVHTRPVLAVVTAGEIFVATSGASRKAHNLRRDPRCSLAARAAGLDIVVEARVEPVTDRVALDRAAQEYAGKYGWVVEVRDAAFWADGAPTAGPPPYDLVRLVPVRAYAFGTAETSTRWSF